ncbi:hypothetical protein NP493_1156g01008 [Ridgeia piscesae]|uniref:THO complex subunit 2 N-terminal domain-containing protein n=1 Tax=Ridgeia piscesae TaxID=27915 RepID=A0AAD9NHA0_RIDPI|nr:hypothetical protein NP493_1156g01008 [Ridgeia piscesae]
MRFKRDQPEVPPNSVKFCRGLLTGHKDVDVSRALYEACWHAVVNNLDIDHLLAALDDVTKLHADVPSLLADVYSIIDTETLCNEKKEERERFINLVANTMHIVPDCLLKERLDLDTLETMGIIHAKQTFQQKYVKVKTKLYYKQQKFNLLREESEGYSKLITELNQDFAEGVSCLDILENIKSLIGCFSLDPNRVLDVLLESFECRPQLASFFVPLLRSYMCNNDLSTICHMLGFKFHWCQRMEDGETPESLYRIAALLINHNLVDIDTFYPHVSTPTH